MPTILRKAIVWVSENKLLVLVIFLGGALRFWGVDPGFPPYHSDEGISYSSAVVMIKNGNLDPGRYDYPSVVPLINYIFFKGFFIPASWAFYYLGHIAELLDGLIKLPLSVEDAKRIFQLDILGVREINALFWGRYVTALFGVGVVFLSFLVGRKLFDFRVGILTSLLVAVNYRQVLNSHIGLPDVYNAFFLLLSFLAAIRLLSAPSRKNYLLAGVSAGLSFATKYQFFSFFPLFLVHILLTAQKEKEERLKFLFSKEIFVSVMVIFWIFLILNPYHFINFEETGEWLRSVSGKYRTGRMELDFFPFSYLFHIGLGKATSLAVALGLVFTFLKRRKELLLLLSVIFPFFFIIAYYTGGGFYTRNLVTITPFLLILAGFFFSRLLETKMAKLGFLLFLLLFAASFLENFSKSYVLASNYSEPWNFQTLGTWLSKNIPAKSKVSAHSSVPLPIEGVERLPYDFHLSFSVEEFREDGADYAIANLDWETNEFYWWMTRSTKESLKFWNKPVETLEKSYSAMALRELSDFAVYSQIKPWLAPESNFVVARVPNFKLLKKEKSAAYEVGEINEGWSSPPIEVSNWAGFVLEYRMNTKSDNPLVRGGYISASLYRLFEDAISGRNRIGVRLSRRGRIIEAGENKLVGEIPRGVSFLVLEFSSYDASSTNSLEYIRLYRGKTDIGISKDDLGPIKLDNNLIFPNSHGNL